jgi:O-antigen/teichoic acid export membrane protein
MPPPAGVPVATPPPEVSARSVGRAASWVGVGHLASQGTWFASLLVLAAFVPPRAFGLVSAALVLTSAANLVVGSGTRGAIITSPRLTVEHLRYAVALNVGVGVLLTAVLVALAAPVLRLVLPEGDPAVLRWLLIGVAVHALSVVPLAVLEKQMEFKRVAAVWAGGALVGSVAAGVAGVLGAGVWALVLRQLVFAAVLTALAWVAARHLLPGPRQLVGRVRRPRGGRGETARWFFLMSIFWEIKLWADNVVVGRVAGPTQLGLYSLAFTIGFAPLTHFAWKLGDVLLPAAAATAEHAALRRRTLRALRVVGLVLIPLVAPALVLAPWLVPLAFGERWSPLVVPLQILLPVGVAQALVHVVAESLSGSGHIALHARLQFAWTVLLVPALIVLVQLDGIRGAAIAQLAVLLPVAAAYVVLAGPRLGLGRTGLLRAFGPFAAPLAAQVATTVAVLVLLDAGSADGGARLAAAAAGVVAGAATLLLTRSVLVGEGRAAVQAVTGRG